MQRQLITTADGSPTLFVAELNEHYHSVHGAVQESMHVFIKHGLEHVLSQKRNIQLLEVGFGTGLNAFLTFLHKGNANISYTGIEAYPIDTSLVAQLPYPQLVQAEKEAPVFSAMHQLPWNTEHLLSPQFSFTKTDTALQSYRANEQTFDLIYFDAFAPTAQPELWTEEVFANMYGLLKSGGILVTYCAKGSVKRAMKTSGFVIERLPGPPGKREMTCAIKT